MIPTFLVITNLIYINIEKALKEFDGDYDLDELRLCELNLLVKLQINIEIFDVH